MKCAICGRLGIWSQRHGMTLCNACKRKEEIGKLLGLIEIAQISGITSEPTDRILNILCVRREDKE